MFLFNKSMSAQNLIPNSSFEESSDCPNNADQLSYLIGWSNPSKSSPDFYSGCFGDSISKKTIVGVPCNFNGCKAPHTGNAYVGLVLSSSDPKYREYIQTKFKSKLELGKQYEYSLWLSLADSSNYQTNGLGLCFSSNGNLGTGNVYDGGIILSSQNSTSWNELKDSKKNKDWIQVKGIYTSLGNEEYLTIGIFKDDNIKLKIKKIKKAEKQHMSYAYYYIDDIELTLIN
jgi:hypothetical protein